MKSFGCALLVLISIQLFFSLVLQVPSALKYNRYNNRRHPPSLGPIFLWGAPLIKVPPSFSLQTEYTTHMRHYTPLDILYSALFCDDKRDTISLCSIMQWLLLLHFCSLHVAWGLGRDIACQSVNIINKSPIVIPTLTSDFLIQRVCRRCVTTSRNLFACPSALKLTSRFWILLARGP